MFSNFLFPKFWTHGENEAKQHFRQVVEECLDCTDQSKTPEESLSFIHMQFSKYLSGYRRSLSTDQKLLVLKIRNLLVAKVEYRFRKIAASCYPIGYFIDLSNTCHVGCECCIHSLDREYAEKQFQIRNRKKGIMKRETHDNIIKSAGLYSFRAVYHNKAESLINKYAPEFFLNANKCRISTNISTNLSLPRLDADAIVESGLTRLQCAIDGTTQDVYEIYRRGGDINIIFENVRRLVEARKRLRVTTPILEWKFLTFEHNVHQVEDAIQLAKRIGFDELSIFPARSGPTLRTAIHSLFRNTNGWGKYQFNSYNRQNMRIVVADNSDLDDIIDEKLEESVIARFENVNQGLDAALTKTYKDANVICDWLHLNTGFDANGTTKPCSQSELKARGAFDFSSINTDGSDFLNTERYHWARLSVIDPAAARKQFSSGPTLEEPVCVTCTKRQRSLVGLHFARGWFQMWQKPATCIHDWTPPKLRVRLTDWSGHVVDPTQPLSSPMQISMAEAPWNDDTQMRKQVFKDLPTILLLHMPNTGGRSVYRLMIKSFGKGHVFIPGRTIFENAQLISSLSDEDKASIHAVCAHMPYGAHQYFPKSLYMTMFRDPVEAAISGYYHMKGHCVPGKAQLEASNADILEYSRMLPNQFTRRLLKYDFLDPCLWMQRPMDIALGSSGKKEWTLRALGWAEFEEAAEVLRSFDVVGLMDKFNMSAGLLARKLGIELPTVHLLEPDPPPSYEAEVPNEVREQLRELNAFDVELYDLACKLFDAQFTMPPSSMKRSTNSRDVGPEETALIAAGHSPAYCTGSIQ